MQNCARTNHWLEKSRSFQSEPMQVAEQSDAWRFWENVQRYVYRSNNICERRYRVPVRDDSEEPICGDLWAECMKAGSTLWKAQKCITFIFAKYMYE